MITLLSTVVSFLAGGLPKILDFFQDKSDKKQEMEMARLQTERELAMAKEGYLAQLKIEEVRTDQVRMQTTADTHKALLDHDKAIGEGASTWVINLRASVRPVITYCMFFMLCFINIFGAWYAVQQGTPFKETLDLLWDAETQTLFASIISFWFGSQAFAAKK